MAVSLLERMQTFGAPSLGAMRRGAGYVPDVAQNANVPTTFPIGLSQLAGATKYVAPVINGPATVAWNGFNNRPPRSFDTDTYQTVTQGTNAYTATWTRVSGDGGISCQNTAAVAGPMRAFGGVNQGDIINISAVWQLAISDGVTTQTKQVTFNFTSE